jgi:ZIP family zinc transporter
MPTMLRAGALGFLAAATLVLGAWIGTKAQLSKRNLGLVIGFGAGALISAVSFELVDEALATGGTRTLTLGLAGGALLYFFASRAVTRISAARGTGAADSASGLSITIGAAIDGIPESVILGVSLIGGGRVPSSFFVAVLVSNLPEGISAATDLRRGGEPPKTIILRFLWIAIASGAAAAIGFVLFDHLDPRALAFVQAFAAGGLLTMVMDTMAPDAFEEAGPLSGLIAVAGFELAFLLSSVS